MKLIVYISALTLLFTACKKDESLVKTQEMDGFHSVEINSAFTITLVEDVSYYVEIKGNSSFVDQCQTSVTDSTLYISSNASNKWTHPSDNAVEIVIHAPPLKLVTANETCFISSSTPITSNEFGLVMKSKANEADLTLKSL